MSLLHAENKAEIWGNEQVLIKTNIELQKHDKDDGGTDPNMW
jgi:hypothetical protein